MKKIVVLLMALLLFGCSSTGTLGIVARSTGDPGALLRNGKSFKELGAVSGSSSRFFLLAIVPWGDGTFSTAVNDALAKKGGDALINVTVTNSMYGFIPIYNIFCYSTTEVYGIAVRFEDK